MRLLNKKQAGELIGAHPEHLMRLAREGKFPSPIKLGDKPNCGVRWIEDDLVDYVKQRLAARSGASLRQKNSADCLANFHC